MKMFTAIFLASLLGVAVGCAKAPAPNSSDSPPSSPAKTQSAAEPGASTPPQIAAPMPVTNPSPTPPMTAVEESAGSGALGKNIVLAANASPAPPAGGWQYQEGTHFSRLTAAQGTSSAPGKIEVAEVFWYGCSHCYNLEPTLTDWRNKLPSDVAFVRIPVMWNPTNEIHGRIYYTSQALGKEAAITAAMFRAIHQENRPMTEEQDIQVLFAANGVSAADFNQTFRSFSVESQLKRAKDLTLKYRVRGVPLLVIDGKYTTDGPQIRSHQDLPALTEELIQRERQRT